MPTNAKTKQIRDRILKVFADRVVEKGLKATTMRSVAHAAELGRAEIYRYFPTRTAILSAYYHDHMVTCIDNLKRVDEFNAYSLQEKLQLFIESCLEAFLADREFVDRSFGAVFFPCGFNGHSVQAIREVFEQFVDTVFQAAIATGEMPPQVYQGVIYRFFWDYYRAVVVYWLRDTSEQFQNTTVLLDKSLELFCTVLQAGLVNKSHDLGVHLIKTHLLKSFGFMQATMAGIGSIKRNLFGE